MGESIPGKDGHFNPRAPYGARHDGGQSWRNLHLISIHAPHTGRDRNLHLGQRIHKRFQSTRPIRGATVCACVAETLHASFQSTRPIRGATYSAAGCGSAKVNFNPRAPYGARRTGWPSSSILASIFQSTRPIRGATPAMAVAPVSPPDFNPRAPYGARQQKCIIYVLHFCNNRQSKHKNQQETSSVRTFF